MLERKIKHLEFIQNVIARMNSNSFFIKGWGMTLVSALFAFAAKDANTNYVLIAYIILPAFWVLDGFFVANERQYRKLYDEVRNKEEDIIDFSMNASAFNSEENTWLMSVFSKTLLLYYGITIVVTLVVMFVLQ